MNIRVFAIILAIFAFFSCEKTPPPSDPVPVFEVFVNNEFNELNGRFAIFVSDQNTGEIRAFRWAPGEDTTLLQVPNSKPTDRFDCTVFRITTLTAPGTGVRDTFLNLTTYTDMGNGAQINLRNTAYQKGTSIKFNLTGMNTLDSITVPDAYAISKPQSINNYTGEYFCNHTGKCWVRILVDGNPFWRFVRFDNVDGPTLNASTLDANLFLSILSPPIKINFPFLAAWDYKVDGLVDTTKLEFFPLSPLLSVSGAPNPITQTADIFEPVNNDLFGPNRPYEGFRLQTHGTENAAGGGYTYISDHFYNPIPATLPVPAFDLLPTILSDKRLIAVECSGSFNLLAFSRVRSIHGDPMNIAWEVLIKPKAGIVSYRLPDVPTPLAASYKALKSYDFNAGVRARAESYEVPMTYEKIVQQHISASDVLWQARAGYLGREESF